MGIPSTTLISTIPNGIVEKIGKKLEGHLHNRLWTRACISEEVKMFPYRMGKAEVIYKSYFPKHQSTKLPKKLNNQCTRFIVNIPEGRRPSDHSDERYVSMLEKIRKEGFSTRTSSSSVMGSTRLGVVVGTNQVKSLDPKLNKKFKKMIKNTPPYEGLASRRVGFLWKPTYKLVSGDKNFIYRFEDSWNLLEKLSKVLSRAKKKKPVEPLKKNTKNFLESVRVFIEEKAPKKPIPFQEIRQYIFKHDLTRDLLKAFERNDKNPIYLTVMDADFLQLRLDSEQGIFSKASEALSKKDASVVGFGYRTKKTELPIVKIAVEMDMAVRDAITKIIPYGAYLPEPFLCVSLKNPNEKNHLKKLSFTGHGSALESRRLIQNGREKGALDDQMHFEKKGLVTTSPARWKTKKNKNNPELTIKNLQEGLKRIRKLSQSHCHTLKAAENIYAAIPFSTSKVGATRGFIATIFKAYDPLSKILDLDENPSEKELKKLLKNIHKLNENEKAALKEAKKNLNTLHMDKKLIKKIEEAAKASGSAIKKVLKNYFFG